MNRLKFLLSVLALSLLIALRCTTSVEADPAALWQLDLAHSNAHFAVAHMGISTVQGYFTKIDGSCYFDGKDLNSASVSATLDASSVDTRNADRDADLKSDKFFDVAKYPTLTFKSRRFRVMSPGKFQVTGELTIHGVTKTVVLDGKGPTAVVKDPWGHYRVGASLSTDINRKDYGLVWNKILESGGVLVGENVSITLDVEFVKK